MGSSRTCGDVRPLRAALLPESRSMICASALVLQVDAPEFLHPLSGVHLGSEDVALAIYRDVVQRRELADLASGPTEAAQRLLRCAVDDAHLAVHAVDHIDEFLV